MIGIISHHKNMKSLLNFFKNRNSKGKNKCNKRRNMFNKSAKDNKIM